MDHPGRLDWDFIPKSDRTGIPMYQLNFHQRTLVQTLLKAALSMRGYTQALEIMAMENILRELEVDRFGVSTGDFRSQDLYYVSFFGRPSFEDTWAWLIFGHHLSLSYTIVGPTVAVCDAVQHGRGTGRDGRAQSASRGRRPRVRRS